MSFGQTEKIVTSTSSEEFLDVISVESDILSYDMDEKKLFNSKLKSKEYVNEKEWINLIIGHHSTHLENYTIKVSKNQEIFTIIEGFKKVCDLEKGDILKHIDGLNIEVKKVQIVERDVVHLKPLSYDKTFYINGVLFKN